MSLTGSTWGYRLIFWLNIVCLLIDISVKTVMFFNGKIYIFKYLLIASPVVLSYAANLSLCPFPSAAAHVDS